MRQTLRRSCAACAKSKHSCDLGTPRCSRCIRRNVRCEYANQPLSAPGPPTTHTLGAVAHARGSPGSSGPLTEYTFGALDPFESYPQTRLSRDHVQRLIHSFLHKIAFQYYPLDLNPTSNPFLVSWWPLALGDPALFHVSLQTACLDEELLAQKGFRTSEMLMADSVALLRRKVGNTTLAIHDGTMNSVITLAAIEFGKGNIKVSQMHVDGAKRLVDMRGGINAVRQTSPLTARMISWVSMLVTGHPQFETQDDDGVGYGIPPIPEWQLEPGALLEETDWLDLDIDFPVWNVFVRLRAVFQRAQRTPLSTTRLHDLTCFVVHRLLLSGIPDTVDKQSSTISECIRYGIILYMFITQGPTYFSHTVILDALMERFVEHVDKLGTIPRVLVIHGSLDIWLLAIGMVASSGTPRYHWFAERAQATFTSLHIASWDDALARIQSVLWLDTPKGEGLFRPHWDAFLGASTPSAAVELTLRPSPATGIIP